ncbi:MAG: hypothetical protein FD163_2214 [Hyphomonadaceae bacterium]|nr:MAG: hypothetical protein FD163_2214 [Hyphomonadaceae bacterium]
MEIFWAVDVLSPSLEGRWRGEAVTERWSCRDHKHLHLPNRFHPSDAHSRASFPRGKHIDRKSFPQGKVPRRGGRVTGTAITKIAKRPTVFTLQSLRDSFPRGKHLNLTQSLSLSLHRQSYFQYSQSHQFRSELYRRLS